MKESVSTYKEFENANDAAEAVRALHSEGFEAVETFDLSTHMNQFRDVGAPPGRKQFIYLVTGGGLGALLGATLGAFLFYVPAELLQMDHIFKITLFGTGVCTFFGVLIGLQEAWILAKRASAEPNSGGGQPTIGVQVSSTDSSRLKEAINILARFGEKPRWAPFKPAVT